MYVCIYIYMCICGLGVVYTHKTYPKAQFRHLQAPFRVFEVGPCKVKQLRTAIDLFERVLAMVFSMTPRASDYILHLHSYICSQLHSPYLGAVDLASC